VLLLRDGQGGESVTDLKALIERLREHFKATLVERESLCFEAADALEELEKWKNVALRFGERLGSVGPDGYYGFSADQWLKWAQGTDSRFDAERFALRAELAEEKRRVSLREIAAMNCGAELEDWKAKYEAEQRLYSAAREVAIRLFDRECGSGKPGEAESAVDAAIEAKMKEENR
jgi:hypothetical protein